MKNTLIKKHIQKVYPKDIFTSKSRNRPKDLIPSTSSSSMSSSMSSNSSNSSSSSSASRTCCLHGYRFSYLPLSPDTDGAPFFKEQNNVYYICIPVEVCKRNLDIE